MNTWQQLLNDYQEYRRSLRFASRTMKETEYEIRLFIGFMNQHDVFEPKLLRKDHLKEFQKFIGTCRHKNGKHYQSSTINKKIGFIQGLLRYMNKEGIIPNSLLNVLECVKEPKRLPLGVIQHDKLKKALNSIETDNPLSYRDRTIIEVLYSTAIRASECANLDIRHINFFDGTLAVEDGKGAKDRIVPIGKTALRYLETYIKAVRPFLIKTDTKALFLSYSGRRINRMTVTKIVHKHIDDEDTKATAHTLRRSCATELVKGSDGKQLYEIKEFLGHESLNTMKRYVNLTAVELKKMHSQCHPREKDDD